MKLPVGQVNLPFGNSRPGPGERQETNVAKYRTQPQPVLGYLRVESRLPQFRTPRPAESRLNLEMAEKPPVLRGMQVENNGLPDIIEHQSN